MNGSSRVIVVIDEAKDRADQLKALIEFMDAPLVVTATPENWTAKLGDSRLAAVFLSDALPEPAISRVLEGIRTVDPNTPIVMVDGAPHA